MNVPATSQDSPVTSVAEAMARMQALDEALPGGDGLACFNHMYLSLIHISEPTRPY